MARKGLDSQIIFSRIRHRDRFLFHFDFFSNNFLTDKWCSVSKSINHVSDQVSSVSDDLWFVNFIIHLNWGVRMYCEVPHRLCVDICVQWACLGGTLVNVTHAKIGRRCIRRRKVEESMRERINWSTIRSRDFLWARLSLALREKLPRFSCWRPPLAPPHMEQDESIKKSYRLENLNHYE